MEIKSDRLIIRKTQECDLTNIQSLWNNGEVMKWVGFPEGLNQSMEGLKIWHRNLQKSNLAKHLVVLDSYHNFCGELFYLKDIENECASLDIKFLPEAQGRGLAVEALKRFINFVFDTEKEIDAVWTEPSKENVLARKLYSKCGLVEKERPVHMDLGDSYWELTREEWTRKQDD